MEDDDKLLDALISDSFLFRAFMLRVALHLASKEPDPTAWGRRFIDDLYAGIDMSEQKSKASGRPWHEAAREQLDGFAGELERRLRR